MEKAKREVVPNSPSHSPVEPALETRQVFSFVSWQGILPRPDDLHAFGEIDPSFPERIFAHAEREQKHRHEMERRQLDAEVASFNLYASFRMRGQWFAAILTLVGMGVGTWIALSGHPRTGGVVFGITVGPFSPGSWPTRC